MANREALRELQERLAGRLQAAKTEDLTMAWLAVRAGPRNYLLPLTQAGEIAALADIQPLPYVQPWFAGVINLRGALYSVVDLAAWVSAVRDKVPASVSALSASVVTLHAGLEVHSALLVDEVVGLRRAESFVASETVPAEAPAYWGALYTDAQGQAWQLLDLQALAQAPEFLDVRA